MGSEISARWNVSLTDLFRSPSFSIGLSILLFYLAIALIAPLLFPRNLTGMQIDASLVAACTNAPGPTLSLFPFLIGAHPFGETGFLGYGVAQGLIVGSRWDLYLIGIITIPSALIGTGIGLYSGAYGGKIDWVFMSITDVMLSVPYFVFVILAVAVLAPRVSPSEAPDIFIGSMVLVMWAPYARVVRGEALKVSTMPFVESAKASGASQNEIVRKHILPNSWAPVLAQIPVTIALILTLVIAAQYVVALENTHGHGLGCSYNTATLSTAPVVPSFNYPEWGAVLGAGIAYVGAWLPQPGYPLGIEWWGYIIPTIWITVFGLGTLLISDGVRDWTSPRLRR